MKTRLPILLSLVLGGCVSEPAHADVFTPRHQPPPRVVKVAPRRSVAKVAPRRPVVKVAPQPIRGALGYQPAPVPAIPGRAAFDGLFDPFVTGSDSIDGPIPLAAWCGAPEGFSMPWLDGPGLGDNAGGNLQTGGNGGWNQGCGNGGSSGRKNCHPGNQPEVPGPVGVAGVVMAWRQARQIRRRVAAR